uniref:RING-type E3 ubiquitin transferase n=1 Tax=Gouania willdenowi TaxID=441366 RepID=A0A8C5I6S2_GOUWI
MSQHEKKENAKAVCRVCSNRYRDPKILPCLHTFCSDCIARLESFSTSVGPGEPERFGSSVTVLCPDCDSEVELPPCGPAGLSTDHLALDEMFRESVCCVHLCEFCCQAHRRQKRTSSHSVQTLAELKVEGRLCRSVLCPLHPGQELRLFCPPCDRPVCVECSASLHRDHRCCPTGDVIHRHGDHIRQMVSVHLRPRLEQLEESLLKVEASQDALQARVEAAANEVRAFARSYATAVETHCVSLLHRLDELRVQHSNQLQLQGAQLRQTHSDVQHSVDFAERLLNRGSDAEILSAKGVTLTRLTKPAGEVDGFPLVGVINAKMVDVNRCTLEGEGTNGERGVVGEKGSFTLECRDSVGDRIIRGGENVQVSIVNKDKKSCTVEATVTDNEDGSYSVSYTPEEPGIYSVWVCVRAQHVKGSPFILSVKKKLRRHLGNFHCCSFCSSAGNKEARCGCAGTMPGGFKGCGHGHKGHPGKPHWSCCGSTTERSECLPQSVLDAVSSRGHLRTVEL